MEGEGDPIIRPLFASVGAVIPNFNPTFGRLPLRIRFVEWFELQRMILHLNRQTLETRRFRQAFRDRPALEHAIFLEAKVKVMTSGPMLFDHENRHLCILTNPICAPEARIAQNQFLDSRKYGSPKDFNL
jgi:hypothetical protein